MDTIDRIIQRTCRRQPEKSALREKVGGQWQSTSYGQLEKHAEEIGAGLLAMGLECGQPAAILAPASSLWVASYLGILKAGGIAVPIDKELKATEIRHVLTDCQAGILFTEPSFLDVLQEIFPVLPELKQVVLLRPDRRKPLRNQDSGEVHESLSTLVYALTELSERYRVEPKETEQLLELVRQVEEKLPPESLPEPVKAKPKKSKLPKIRKTPQDEGPVIVPLDRFKRSEPLPPSSREAADIALILYTSGTTGRSKGALLSHGNIASNIDAAVEIFRLDESMRTLSFLPINHVYELVCGILLPLSLGGTVSFAESLKQLGNNLAEVKPSFLLGVPAVFAKLHARIMKGIEEKALSRMLFRFSPTRALVAKKVRRILGDGTIFVSGGAALDPAIAAGMMSLGIDIYQGYGITETSPIVAAERPGIKKLGTVGLPLPGVEVRIDSPNDEGVGEIWVRGPNVMRGYFNNPRATEEVLTDGWYHTGDLGFVDEAGFVSIRGRVKNLIVTPNGKNVYPEEVENELLKGRFIAEAMVYGHKVSPAAEEVHALVVPNQEALDAYAREQNIFPLNENDVEALIREEVIAAGKRLADFKRVKKFTLREEELPKTTTRKIKRFAVEADIPAAGATPGEQAEKSL